jgi:hypothetical protein
MTGIAVALAIGVGVGWRRVALLAGALWVPIPLGLLVAGYCWLSRSRDLGGSALFCDAVSKELRAGRSVRQALGLAAESVDAVALADLCDGPAGLDAISVAARSRFPDISGELEAVLRKSGGIGVAPALLFDELAVLALARSEVTHEISIASAPAKASALVLLLAPLGLLSFSIGGGGLAHLLSRPDQRGAALLGLALVVSGLGFGTLVLRRAA